MKAMSRINQKACLSIVLPNYNHADYLPMTLDSILEFQDRIREIVVCDDASTDDSWKILTEYASVHPLIRLIRNEKNLGAMENIRLLLKEASGEFVMVQAADDYWIPEGMGRILDVLCSRRYPEVSFYCGRNLYRIEAENYCYESPAEFPEGVSAPGSVARFRRRAPWGAAGMIAKTALYRDLFEKLIPSGSYYDRFMQLLLAERHPIYFLNGTIATMRIMPRNFSRNAGGKEKDRAFLLLFRMMKTEYRDLYLDMLKSNHFADYEGMYSFLIRTPSVWDEYTPLILLRMTPCLLYRNFRYRLLPGILPGALKRCYRTWKQKKMLTKQEKT